MADKYINTTRAAEILGLTRQWVGHLCREGILAAIRIGRVWAVSLGSVLALKEKRDDDIF